MIQLLTLSLLMGSYTPAKKITPLTLKVKKVKKKKGTTCTLVLSRMNPFVNLAVIRCNKNYWLVIQPRNKHLKLVTAVTTLILNASFKRYRLYYVTTQTKKQTTMIVYRMKIW